MPEGWSASPGVAAFRTKVQLLKVEPKLRNIEVWGQWSFRTQRLEEHEEVNEEAKLGSQLLLNVA